MLGFSIATQLAHERVELGVRDLGLVLPEVALVVILDRLAQLCRAVDDLLRWRHAPSLPTG